eukprot:TRINITY_DN8228_c0_g1_i1.p1 TRINITY_DN8228_c0_g1~~TRINITY_DN8228_c0_g1_i1.p1  ORF type:complete len:204 (+),score=24.34 TRINITY_DN8228_c0_g1_i1:58-669(+)
MIEVKCVIVGDGAVGKTCLLISYIEDKFPTEYVPTVFENYEQELQFEGQDVKLSLWDTAGQEGFTKIRTLSYPKTDVFLLCYSVVNPASFINAKEQWSKEIHQHCPQARIILIGTKIDLREDKDTLDDLRKQGKDVITQDQGKAKATELGALIYLECSALTQIGLKEVFETALGYALENNNLNPAVAHQATAKKKKDPKCAVM